MNTDDPRLTAYALNDPALLDEPTRAEIEADPALAAEIADLRRLADSLRAELHAEEGTPLTAEQRAAVLAASTADSGQKIIRPRTAWWRRPAWAASAAACLLAGLSLATYYQIQHVRGLRPRTAHAEKYGTVFPGVKLTGMDTEAILAPPEDTLALGMPAPTTGPATTPSPNLWMAQSGAITARGDQLSDPLSIAGRAPARSFAGVEVQTASEGTLGDEGKSHRFSEVNVPAARPPLTANQPETAMRGLSPAVSDPMSLRFGSTRGGTDGTERMYFRTDGAAKVQSAGKASVGKPLADLAASAPAPDRLSREKEVRQQIAKLESDVSQPDRSMAAPAYLEELRAKLGKEEAEVGRGLALVEQEAVVKERVEELTKLREELVQLAQTEPANTEAYDAISDNPFLAAAQNPLSTFSVDVDTASYANVRRFLNANQRPPKGAVRIEELVNYFRYDYPQPAGNDPFAATLEVATCPWQPEHRLVRVGLKGREILRSQRGPSNLVFLVDVSGSMEPENKLPLVQECLRLLTDQLGPDDSVSIAVYAGASGCVLEPTHDKDKVRAALARLKSGGSTNGAAGIQLAYDLAQRAFKKGGTNRVILCTDGDFNVGISSQDQLVSMIQDKAKTGIFLSVLGFGMGNLKDSTLEKLADKGNGNYGYIDSLTEGRRVFVEQMTGTLCTIAKDVKIQVEFNPAQVGAYRLIGYENRLLAKEDFNDDTKDAGEIGAGHTITALYEIVPAGKAAPGAATVDELKYAVAKPEGENRKAESAELLTVKVRYKKPDGEVSTKLEFPLTDSGTKWEQSSRDFRWAAAVAGFGMMLRESPHKGSLSWSLVEELAAEGRAEKQNAERAEFVSLVEKARALAR